MLKRHADTFEVKKDDAAFASHVLLLLLVAAGFSDGRFQKALYLLKTLSGAAGLDPDSIETQWADIRDSVDHPRVFDAC
jgi:hypothetical protein